MYPVSGHTRFGALPALAVGDYFDRFSEAADSALTLASPSCQPRERGRGRQARARSQQKIMRRSLIRQRTSGPCGGLCEAQATISAAAPSAWWRQDSLFTSP